MRNVSSWLADSKFKAPPEPIGYWGDLCDELYRYQQSHEKEKNQLRADIAYLRDSFTSLTDAIVMIDPQGCIQWCNDAAQHILGLGLPQDLGQNITHLFREPAFVQFYESMNYQEPLKVQGPTAEEKVLKVQITTFGQGNRLIFARDITDIARLEAIRQDFVSNVSHELRTPLTVIMGYLDNFLLLSDQVPQIQAPLEQMSQQANRMSKLINELLDLSRLETLPAVQHTTVVDMALLVERIVAEVKIALEAEGKHHQLTTSTESLLVFGDETELHSVLLNLVMNACKYTPEIGTIHVSAFTQQGKGVISVQDNGVGIDPVDAARLTERFYRVDKSRSINTGGTGLGLAIVKRILIRHEAKLSIESQIGQGSCFICTFPPHKLAEIRSPDSSDDNAKHGSS